MSSKSSPAVAQTIISTDEIVRALTVDKPSKMSSAEIEAQKSVKVVLTDVSKMTSLDTPVKVKVEKSLKKDYIPAIDLSVYFDFDSATITDKAKATLDPLVRALENPKLIGSTIVLAGFTDATGKPDYNRDLSQRRASSVKNYLVSDHACGRSFWSMWASANSTPKIRRIPNRPLTAGCRSSILADEPLDSRQSPSRT